MNTLCRYICKCPLRVVSILMMMVVGALFLQSCTSGNSNSGSSVNTQFYTQTNLVSDGAVSAGNIDTKLVNPWGISFSPTGTFWVSDNGTGVTTVYNGAGQLFPLAPSAPLVVTIPPPAGSPAGTQSKPTGQVFNGSSTNFVISDGVKTGPSLFIFATEDGTISGWNHTVNAANAILVVDNSSSNAVYKGLAISSDSSRLYAANFQAGTVDMFDSNFAFMFSFTDSLHSPSIDGFAPFNVHDINGKLYVTYAKQKPGTPDDQSGPGNGFVDVFDENGTLLQRLASKGTLNSPWGLAIAPADFGQFSNALLVGNFGDGKINAFDVTNGSFLGQLSKDAYGNPIKIDGLWALTFGNGGDAGNTNELFFTAGPNEEANGLFGKLTVP